MESRRSSRKKHKVKMPSATTGFISEEKYVENVSIGDYIIIKELGSGSTATVVLAFDKNTERRVAIKIVKKQEYRKSCKSSSTSTIGADSGFNDERIYREVIISVLLDHPHIVKLLDFLYSDEHFFLVFEYAKGRQLYDIILKETRLSEDVARKYFRQIISAIDYIHKNCIVHRDLKIENIIIDQNDNVKLLDFGLANFFDNKSFLKTCCGSLYFAAPELLHGEMYTGPEVDIWSLGIILYSMLCGRVPFDDESVKDLQLKIRSGIFDFAAPISNDSRILISGMITVDPMRRLTMREIIKSVWLNKNHVGKVENYVGKRFPLRIMNSEYKKALESVLKFQIPNLVDDLESYFETCKKQSTSVDVSFWMKIPAISMYYLLSENRGSYSGTDEAQSVFQSKFESIYEALHVFVKFIFSDCQASRSLKYFHTDVFQESSQENDSASHVSMNTNTPSIKKSYIKGIFHGIKAKHIGSHNAFKKIILDIFKKNSISFEADENGYYCSFYNNDEECYFKVTLYFNVLLSEYYVVLTCLNSKKTSFDTIYQSIERSLKYR